MNACVEGFGLVRFDLRQEKGGSLVAPRPVLEMGGAEVSIGMRVIVCEVG